MNFDSLNKADCVIPQSLIDGGSGGQQQDDRCNDSAFAAANPSICGSKSYLIIKPSSALIMRLSTVSYTVFEYANGVESQVIDGLKFSSSNPDIFLIGASSGSGTGLAKGSSIITVTRKGLSASASVTVLDSTVGCSQTAVKSLILIDTSRSSSLTFGGIYQTKLDFAKAAAKRWADKMILVNGVAKDGYKVDSFSNAIADVTGDYLGDQTVLDADIDAIEQTLDKTTIFDALSSAIIDITLEMADEKIIIIISDGDQTTSSNVQPILDAAAAFKAAGGIIVVVGLRASGAGFDLLERVATGGFFLNAMLATAESTLDGLAFLKSALCVGTCLTAGDVFVNQAHLDYSSFKNWEVIAGQVDLIGNGAYDYLPGNGLYVDMIGTNGYTRSNTIRSIDRFALVAGTDYTISFKCAGNNRKDVGVQSLKIYVRDPSSNPTDANIFEHIVSPAWDSGFQTYSFTFTATAAASVKIYFQQMLDALALDSSFGNILDEVFFGDSNLVTLLDDDFNSENPIYIPPACGIGTIPIANGGTGTVSLIPLMSGYTIPSGIVSSSGEVYAPNRLAWMAFNGAQFNQLTWDTGIWQSGVPTSNQWLMYQFPSAKAVIAYQFAGTMGSDATPTTWIFQGSNNGSVWSDLHTVTNHVWAHSTTNAQADGYYVEKFSIANSTSYLYYRIYISDAVGKAFLISLVSGYAVGQFQMFSDSPTYGFITGYGGCYSDACSQTDAISTQFQDPSPLPDIESGVAPKKYTSTQSFCASCLAGNVNVGADDSGVGSRTVVEVADGTYFNFDTPPTLNTICWTFTATAAFVLSVYGSNDAVSWTKIFLLNGRFQANANGDVQLIGGRASCCIFEPMQYKYFKLAYDKSKAALTLYSFAGIKIADAQQVCKQAQATSYISQSDADSKALAAATLAAQTELNCMQLYTSTQSYLATCLIGLGTPVTKTVTKTSFISQADADALATAQAKSDALAALDCTGSNNTQTILLPNAANVKGVPYPSIKFVSGATGHIAKVTATVKKFTHTRSPFVVALLVAPDGVTNCLLMAGCGNPVGVTNLDLVFDDAAGSHLPLGGSGPLVAGTFKPTQSSCPVLPLPAPQFGSWTNYGTTLAVFNGLVANGSWALYTFNEFSADFGQITQGFDLSITSV